MHEPVDPAAARALLLGLMSKLDDDLALAKGSAGTVELDQTAVGRLSRMDALQQQAMARASVQRLEVQRRRIAAALDRIDAGTYGLCCACGGEVEAERLRLDALVLFCVDCQAERSASP